jgi:MoaA/NifB/PqqE/SkfB family radical SAM enzyme
MPTMNGTQLYGLRKLKARLRMSFHRELKGLTLKQKLALGRVSKQSKLTRLGNEIYSNTFTPFFPSPAYDRFMKGIVSVASGTPVPVVTNFAVTSKCPCKCWHCSFSGRDKANELSLEELKRAVSDVQDLGASVIGLTGGEPLLRPDLEEIISCIGERSMPLLFTTGLELTQEKARELKRAGLKIPVVSLDHYRCEVHDRGRNREGMYNYAIKAIDMFQKEGLYVAVSFVPDRELMDNPEELHKTIEFFRYLGINDMRLTSPILSGRLTDHPEMLLSQENVGTIFEIQQVCTNTPGYPGVFAYDYFESDLFYGCGAGYNYMFIDAQGNVCPCDFTMVSIGNIRERSVKEIWKETSSLFRRPGIGCYANKCSHKIAAMAPKEFPLHAEASREVIEECPPFNEGELPLFYKEMNLRIQDPEERS